MSYNAWLYTFDNPINWVDRTGHSPTVDCNQISLPDLRSYCEAGNGDDNDLQVLKARFLFFSEIAELSKTIGVFDDGYWWAGEMLEHFLEKGGAYKEVKLPSSTTLDRDGGVIRATKIKAPKSAPDEPEQIEPLLYELLRTIKPELGCNFYQPINSRRIIGDNNYTPNTMTPRPYGKGWWGAFGHFPINATYSNIVALRYPVGGYYITMTASYDADDIYEWFPEEGKLTPLPLNLYFDGKFHIGSVNIPHAWEKSLENHGSVNAYSFRISWSEKFTVMVSDDFSEIRFSDGSGPFSLR